MSCGLASADSNRANVSYSEEVVYGNPVATRSEGLLTVGVNPSNTDTMTIGTTVYTFVTTLSGAADEILIGASLTETQQNIVDAVSVIRAKDRGEGYNYGVGTVLNPAAEVGRFTNNSARVIARAAGVAGDAIVTTESFTSGSNIFDAGTLGTQVAGVDGTFISTRMTGESLKQDTTTNTSAEIRSDRQVADILRNGVATSGDINGELSYLVYQDFMKAVLFADVDWTTEVSDISGAVTISFDASDNSVNDSGAGFTNYTDYGWINISGAANPANNGIFKISNKVSNSKMILQNSIVVTEAATAAISITQGSEITNGVLCRSYSIYKDFTDVDNFGELFVGSVFDTFTLTVSAEAIITAAFGIQGKEMEIRTADPYTTLNAAAAGEVMTSTDNVDVFLNDGHPYDSTEFTLSLTNNLRTKPQIGSVSTVGIGTGKVDLTGTLNAYFVDKNEMEKYVNFDSICLSQNVLDTDGNRMIFDIPKAKITDAQTVAGGQDQDVLAELSWTAVRDPDEDITIRIVKFDA